MNETIRSGQAGEPQALEADPALVLGGRYRLVDALGHGGMGVVYRALDLGLGEMIAVKFLATPTPTPGRIARLHDEARLARKVTHRNVARIYDIGEDGGRWYLTMQLVEGASLRQVLGPRQRLPRAQAVEIAVEICEGLAAAHAAGVLHMDLKPENVMLARGGGVVVLDFGVARLASGDDDGRIVGTPAYMAPEQRIGARCDQRSDLYAIGVILHEMLTGTREVVDASMPALDGLPATLVALVASLLAFDPDDRPPSARAVADALHGELGVASIRAWTDRRTAKLKLAVMAFHGDEDGIVEQLVDRLSTLQDATVLAASATARLGDLDPRAAGAQLGVDVVVEGTLRRTGDDVVVTARLVETEHGTVAWSERFVGTVSEVLHLNEQLARRIAEALRVELGALPYRGVASDEAVAMYMRARRKLARVELVGPDGAMEDLDRVVALAPELTPAYALRALAYARAWFFALVADHDDWRARAMRAIRDASVRARGFPETELAAGVLAWQNGQLADAVGHFARTLELAPSQPVALEYLGRLLCEGGRAEQGASYVALACDLDPQLWMGLIDLARHYALHRCWPEYEATMAKIARRGGGAGVMRGLELRVGVWRRSQDAVSKAAGEIEIQIELPTHRIFQAYAAVALGGDDIGELDALVSELLASRIPRRFASFAHQLAAEAAGGHRQPERAFHHLQAASDAGLIDIEWLDLCPVLHEARSVVGFTELRRTVRMRAAALWRSELGRS